jgi:hypothetical protein
MGHVIQINKIYSLCPLFHRAYEWLGVWHRRLRLRGYMRVEGLGAPCVVLLQWVLPSCDLEFS